MREQSIRSWAAMAFLGASVTVVVGLASGCNSPSASVSGADSGLLDSRGAGGQVGTGGTTTSSGGTAAGGMPASGGGSGSDASGGGGAGGRSSASGGVIGTGGLLALGGSTALGGVGAGTGGATALATGGNQIPGGAVGAGGLSTGGAISGSGGRATGGAAGASSTSSQTGGSQGTYNPCPSAGAPCVVMPLGDSITYGYASTNGGGYRSELFKLAVADNLSLTFVGSQVAGPTTMSGKTFPRNNEGRSAYTIDDYPSASLKGLIPVIDAGAMTTYKPQVVLLMIGTNDVNKNVDLANAPTRLGKLIDKIIAGAPDALLILAKIIPDNRDSGNTKTQTYNAAMANLVQQRVALGKHIVLVDQYSPFVAVDWMATLMSDSLHPNDKGYTLMAQTWYTTLKPLLR